MTYLGTLLAVVLIPFFVWGQEGTETTTSVEAPAVEKETEETTQNSSAKSGRVEKIEVTGSHIKRIDVEGPSPVLTLDRDYLTRSGFNNVGDVLRETTVASFGGTRETALSGGADTGASTTSLRGFGADRILVLLDGARLPTIGGQSSVDLSLIPMAAVERIEIVKDGASAIYGSDALGGVINIITKKDYDGATVELGYTTPEEFGGNRLDVKGSYGKTFSKGSFLSVLQYRKNQETWSRDYDYARPTLPWQSSFGSPGTWFDPTNGAQAGGGADPCPVERSNNGVCRFDYSEYSQITPRIEQVSALLRGDYEINEDIKLTASGVYSRRDVRNQLAPPPDRFADQSALGLPNTQVPTSVTGAGPTPAAGTWGLPTTGAPTEIRYRLVEEAGPRISDVITDSYNVNVGARGYISDTWEWKSSITHGASTTDNLGFSGYANKQVLYNTAINNPLDFNPFAAPGSKANLDAIPGARYQPLNVIESSMSTVNVSAQGELVDMPAGPLSLAVGASNAWQTFDQETDSITGAGQQWGGGVAATGSGRRDFQSAYTEFAIPALESLELQAAGRFDNFSDFGSTFNPKFGFRYKPLNSVLFRGSWGTGFRAPSLADLYQAQLITFPFADDPISGQQYQIQQVTRGSQNLREETTESFNVGTAIQITESVSFVFDYWKTAQKNQVAQTSTRDIFRAEQALGIPALNAQGIQIERDPVTNLVTSLVNPALNLASVDVSGMDFKLNYRQKLFGAWNFNAEMNHAILIEYIVEPIPGVPLEDRVGFSGVPYWRNNISLGVGNRIWEFTATIRSIGETNASELALNPGDFGKTRDHTELDLRVQYVAPWDGTFSVLVRNVFNTDRPQLREYLSNGFLDTSIYDPFGRAVGVNYRQDF
jgi:iron complex outermembrane receptor protein